MRQKLADPTQSSFKPVNCTKYYLSPVSVFKLRKGVFLIKLTRKILSREKFSFFVKTNIHFSHSTSQKSLLLNRIGGAIILTGPISLHGIVLSTSVELLGFLTLLFSI